MSNDQPDPRVQQTRGAILGAFNRLILERPYAGIHVDDIAQSAGVGRSTFYEHFRNKDELFRYSVSAVLGPLADALTGSANPGAIRHILEHIRENHRAARALFCGEPSAQASRRHAELIESRLAELCAANASRPVIPIELAAAQIAEMQLGLLRTWLEGQHRCDTAALAASICEASRAVAGALLRQSSETRV